jgi:hypothetical protein
MLSSAADPEAVSGAFRILESPWLCGFLHKTWAKRQGKILFTAFKGLPSFSRAAAATKRRKG